MKLITVNIVHDEARNVVSHNLVPNPFGVVVPAPRHLTLERQLNKSVLIGWTLPEPAALAHQIESYHVYVDGVLKVTVKANERTRALVEGVDSNRVSINATQDPSPPDIYKLIETFDCSHIELVCVA